eukprot:4933746-Amphidinium_carterae.1
MDMQVRPCWPSNLASYPQIWAPPFQTCALTSLKEDCTKKHYMALLLAALCMLQVKFLNPQHPQPLPFKPPKRVDIVGSFLLGTYCRTSEVLKVDVAVQMCIEGFKERDVHGADS